MNKNVRRLSQAQAAGMAHATQGRARVVPDKKNKYNRQRDRKLSQADRDGLASMGRILCDPQATEDEVVSAAFTIMGVFED